MRSLSRLTFFSFSLLSCCLFHSRLRIERSDCRRVARAVCYWLESVGKREKKERDPRQRHGPRTETEKEIARQRKEKEIARQRPRKRKRQIPRQRKRRRQNGRERQLQIDRKKLRQCHRQTERTIDTILVVPSMSSALLLSPSRPRSLFPSLPPSA